MMKNKYKKLTYDSKLFGYKVANIININSKNDLRVTLSNLQKEKYRLCYFNTDNEKQHQWANEENGWLADVKVTFSKNILYPKTDLKEIEIFNSKVLTSELISLAFQSGKFSKFKRDPHFVNNEFEKLYIDWIRKSVSGKIADYVLVSKINDKIAGMVTLKFSDSIAIIGLIAVDEHMRGMGIGQKLLKKVEYLAFKNNCSEIKVSTQEMNENAMKFYLKSNFFISSRNLIYHFWF